MIGNTDAGSQCTSVTFTEHFELEGVGQSIGTIADAWAGALMETVIGLMKTECVRTTVFHARPYQTTIDVEWATSGWIAWWNNRRPHSSLAHQAPEEFKQVHYAVLNRELQLA